jgi:hypothetical protein
MAVERSYYRITMNQLTFDGAARQPSIDGSDRLTMPTALWTLKDGGKVITGP